MGGDGDQFDKWGRALCRGWASARGYECETGWGRTGFEVDGAAGLGLDSGGVQDYRGGAPCGAQWMIVKHKQAFVVPVSSVAGGEAEVQ